MSERCIAIIPARGGSKRIPRKNIKTFLGKPIIAYAIELARNSGLFDEIIVSTDDAEIAEVARYLGAKVPFMRSAKNSSDHATTMEVINEVLNFYREKDWDFKYGCCIYPTSPLVQERHLVQGYTKLRERNFNTVLPIVPFGYPVWRGFEITDNEMAKMVWPEYLNSRSQDLKKVYHDAGQWYWFSTSLLAVSNSLYSDNTGYVLLTELEAQDVDTEIDWQLAEVKYKLLKNLK